MTNGYDDISGPFVKAILTHTQLVQFEALYLAKSSLCTCVNACDFRQISHIIMNHDDCSQHGWQTFENKVSVWTSYFTWWLAATCFSYCLWVKWLHDT